jgi:hypothetical protein
MPADRSDIDQAAWQLAPFTVKAVGLPLVPAHEPRKPNETDPPGAMTLFQSKLRTVTAVPDWVWVAFQICVICCPPGKAKPSVHGLIGADPVFLIWTVAWKPPDHWLLIVYVTAQVPTGGALVGTQPPATGWQVDGVPTLFGSENGDRLPAASSAATENTWYAVELPMANATTVAGAVTLTISTMSVH